MSAFLINSQLPVPPINTEHRRIPVRVPPLAAYDTLTGSWPPKGGTLNFSIPELGGYGVHFETANETVLDGRPPISTRSVWLPSVPTVNIPPTLRLPVPSVLPQSGIFQDLPPLVPMR